MFIPPLDLCSYDGEDMSLTAEGRMYDLFTNQRYAECHGIDTMSNGSMSPDFGEMWRHGYPVSPQRESWNWTLQVTATMNTKRTIDL